MTEATGDIEMAGVQQLKQIQTSDRDLQLAQSNIAGLFNAIQQGPFFGGVILSQSLKTGKDNVITHGLGRQAQYWFLLDLQNQAAVWRTAWNDQTITLLCSADCSAKVWVS